MNCTIVSYFKKDIFRKHNGIYPGEFLIPAAKNDDPGLLTIGPSVHYVDGKEDMPPTKVTTDSRRMAESIIGDYIFDTAHAIAPGERQPALFFVEGDISVPEIKAKYKPQIESAKKMQNEWFIELVKLADEEWARNPGRHTLIADNARLAARELNLDRPWMMEAEDIKVNCKFCKTSVDPDAIICFTCKQVLKPELMPEVKK
jgi:hypothetical protein